MQIHELTLKKKQQTNEGIADFAKGAAAKAGGIASKVAGQVDKAKGAVGNIKGAYQGARQDQQVGATADKVQKVWNSYKANLDKYYADSGKTTPPDAYEKALMAFVQKNLLGGAYIPNLTNKDEIVGLVKKIAGTAEAPVDNTPPTPPPAAPPAAPPTAQPPAAGGVRMGSAQKAGTPKIAPAPSSGLPTPAEQEKFQQKLAAAAQKPIQEAIPTVRAPQFKTGGLAARSAQRNAPGKPVAQAPAAQPAQTAAQPAQPAAQSAQPAQTAQAAPKVNPNEKQLFTQLVRAAALSNTAAATGEKTAPADANKKQVQDPHQMIGDVQAAVKPAVDPAKLSAAGQALRQHFQIDSTVSSTGDDAVDALLLAMGFQV